ncbi:hypothetical protein J4204_02455 [Candidatus Woesearchaeota archaeon]|nr:hypothetical protein [Candidatus Woesearchaeota archaeon]
MIAKAKDVLRRLEFGLFEVFVGFFMVIGLVGYFGTLPADLDWIDHTVAFLMFSYFFYILNITSILFGKTARIANIFLVASYLSLFFKDIISYTAANASKFNVMKFVDGFYLFFQNNLELTTIITFYIGIAGIFVVSLYLTKKIEISRPSFLYAVHKDLFNNKLAKFGAIFSALLAFYYLIYNPILEWLEFVLDDPIVLMGIIFFVIKVAGHRHKLHEKHFISKIGDLVWGWYRRFISLFHYKKTLPLAISGLLILHALADLGVFAYSLIFLRENFYLEFLKNEHAPFLKLFIEDAKNVPSFAVVPLLLVYLLNAMSLIILLLIPVIVWTRIFSQKELHLGRIPLFFIYSSVAAYIMLPAYAIVPLTELSAKSGITISGVDILSKPLLESISILDNFLPSKTAAIVVVSLSSLAFGLAVYLMGSKPKIKKELYAISIIGGLTFYAVYIFYFFSSLLEFYSTALQTILTPHFLVALVSMVLLALSIIFYIVGFFMFIYEVVMEYHRKKWSEPIDNELYAAIKGIERKMRVKKAQFIGNVLKYVLMAFVSVAILIAGYSMVNLVKDRACKTEISKFEISLKGIDKSVRFGVRELQSYEAPCKADKIYFFGSGSGINPEYFSDIPIIRDALESGSSKNVFIVKDSEVKSSFHAGRLEMIYPYHICFVPKFDRISFFTEGAGDSVKVAAACSQPECTFIPIDINQEDARSIVKEAVEFGCERCPRELAGEIEKMRLTRDNVEMFRKFSFCDGITDVEIFIRPKEGAEVKDFRFLEYIPKTCIGDLNSYLAENIKGDVTIRGDPLIMWHFDDIGEGKKFSYKLNASLSEDCKQAIKGLGVAQFVEEQKGRYDAANTPPKISGLPDRSLTGARLHRNVIENLWKYAEDAETNPKNLVYSITVQTKPELADCRIKDNKRIDCEVKQNAQETSRVTVQADDLEFSSTASFNVEVAPSCKKKAKKSCIGNEIAWTDSCGEQEEKIEVCEDDEICEDGECEEVCTENAKKECHGDRIYLTRCGKRGDLYQNCKLNPFEKKCRKGKCCFFC